MRHPIPDLRPESLRAADTLPPDRAYLNDLFDRWVKEENEREERLKYYFLWLSVRWAIIWAGVGMVLGVVYLAVF